MAKHPWLSRSDRSSIKCDKFELVSERRDNMWVVRVKGEVELVFAQPPLFMIEES